MTTVIDYYELARECLREAEEAKDDARKKTLIGMAKLYTQTALHLDAGASNPPSPPANKIKRPGTRILRTLLVR